MLRDAWERPELPAGAEHIASFTLSVNHVQARLLVCRLECKDRVVGRAAIGAARKIVERDQVDYSSQARDQLRESPSLLVGIIDPRQDHVFERQALAWRQRQLPAYR